MHNTLKFVTVFCFNVYLSISIQDSFCIRYQNYLDETMKKHQNYLDDTMKTQQNYLDKMMKEYHKE